MLARVSRWGTLLLAGSLWAAAASAEESKGSCRPPGSPPFDPRRPCPVEVKPHAVPTTPAATTWQEPPEDEPTPRVRAHRREAPLDQWYGWQTLLVDVASTGVFLVGTTDVASSSGIGIAALGLLGYVAGGPALHGIHERPAGRVLGSLGLRLGLPLIGGVVGSAAADCKAAEDIDDVGGAFCEIGYTGLGVLVGMGVAMVADSALSFEPSSRTRTSSSLRIAPTVSVTEHESRFGVVGQF